MSDTWSHCTVHTFIMHPACFCRASWLYYLIGDAAAFTDTHMRGRYLYLIGIVNHNCKLWTWLLMSVCYMYLYRSYLRVYIYVCKMLIGILYESLAAYTTSKSFANLLVWRFEGIRSYVVGCSLKCAQVFFLEDFCRFVHFPEYFNFLNHNGCLNNICLIKPKIHPLVFLTNFHILKLIRRVYFARSNLI